MALDFILAHRSEYFQKWKHINLYMSCQQNFQNDITWSNTYAVLFMYAVFIYWSLLLLKYACGFHYMWETCKEVIEAPAQYKLMDFYCCHR